MLIVFVHRSHMMKGYFMQIKLVQFLWKLLQKQEKTLKLYSLRLASFMIIFFDIDHLMILSNLQ